MRKNITREVSNRFEKGALVLLNLKNVICSFFYNNIDGVFNLSVYRIGCYHFAFQV